MSYWHYWTLILCMHNLKYRLNFPRRQHVDSYMWWTLKHTTRHTHAQLPLKVVNTKVTICSHVHRTRRNTTLVPVSWSTHGHSSVGLQLEQATDTKMVDYLPRLFEWTGIEWQDSLSLSGKWISVFVAHNLYRKCSWLKGQIVFIGWCGWQALLGLTTAADLQPLTTSMPMAFKVYYTELVRSQTRVILFCTVHKSGYLGRKLCCFTRLTEVWVWYVSLCGISWYCLSQ